MTCRPLVKGEAPVSVLGLGTIRLPFRGATLEVDEDRAAEIVLRAVGLGINFIDTGHFYLGGRCEQFLGRTLPQHVRERVNVVTKLPAWAIESKGDFDRILDKQLSSLQHDRFRYYMLHGLNRHSWGKIKEMGVLRWLADKREKDVIQHIGFSFHDDYATFQEIVDGFHGWEFCMLQCNYLDPMAEAGLKGIHYARRRGLGVVIMGPLLGGLLAKLPPGATRLLETGTSGRTPVSLALQWLFDLPGVTVVLSGPSTCDELIANAQAAAHCECTRLTAGERRVIVGIRRIFAPVVPCNGCGYCVPCSQGVDIPRNLKLLNMASFFSASEELRALYSEIPLGRRADVCTGCQACISACPRRLDIPDWLGAVSQAFGGRETHEKWTGSGHLCSGSA
jgi:predicted aldo/keto reductase-like oxidoreductase